jgi:phosphoglycerate dehydrogenase-like enzyme
MVEETIKTMKILIASSVSPTAVDLLREQHDVVCAFNAPERELEGLIRDRDTLIFRSGVTISGGVLAAAPDLSLVIRAGSGLDNIDVDYVIRRGLRLERIPEPGAQAVAEMTFGLMLALSRNIVVGHNLTARGRWAKQQLRGNLISGKTLGIIGLGNIGTRVAQLAVAWDMIPIGCVEPGSDVRAEDFEVMGIQLAEFDDVVAAADILSVHVPLQDSTRHLINEDVLRRMKPGSFLVNIARGGVVSESAVKAALEAKHLKGAAMDVHEQEGEGLVSPLAEFSNVVLTPHIGAMAEESQEQIGKRILEIVAAASRAETEGPVPSLK